LKRLIEASRFELAAAANDLPNSSARVFTVERHCRVASAAWRYNYFPIDGWRVDLL
jgi:hypothetical protein